MVEYVDGGSVIIFFGNHYCLIDGFHGRDVVYRMGQTYDFPFEDLTRLDEP